MTVAFWPGWDADAVRAVLHDLRPLDAEEAFARLPAPDPDQLYVQLWLAKDHAPWFEVVRKPDLMGAAAAFAAVTLVSPGVGQVWMLATPDMTLADFVAWKRHLAPVLPGRCVAAGLHRVQASVMASHRAAKRFMAECGMRFEGPERRMGRHGEDFERWVALAGDFIEEGADPRAATRKETDPCV
jgi:hypothetical protein